MVCDGFWRPFLPFLLLDLIVVLICQSLHIPRLLEISMAKICRPEWHMFSENEKFGFIIPSQDLEDGERPLKRLTCKIYRKRSPWEVFGVVRRFDTIRNLNSIWDFTSPPSWSCSTRRSCRHIVQLFFGLRLDGATEFDKPLVPLKPFHLQDSWRTRQAYSTSGFQFKSPKNNKQAPSKTKGQERKAHGRNR